jgi:hypothetical protein
MLHYVRLMAAPSATWRLTGAHLLLQWLGAIPPEMDDVDMFQAHVPTCVLALASAAATALAPPPASPALSAASAVPQGHAYHAHHVTFAVYQGTSNGGQRCANLRSSVNRRSDLPYNGTI